MNKSRATGLRMLAFTLPLLAVSLSLAQANPAPPATPSGKPLAFSIVSIRPHGNAPAGTEGCNVDSCRFVDVPLRLLIDTAYNLSDKLVFGGPSWASSDHFDLDAKIDPPDLPATPLSRQQLVDMLQPVLADRFQLRVHHETRSFPAFNLVLAKGGSKLKPAVLAPGTPAGPCQIASRGEGLTSAHNCWMDAIAHLLWSPSGRTVIDKTGLTGRYDFELHWTPDSVPADSPLAGGPSIFTAVQEQLGLKLSPSTAPLDVLVIDSAQRPSEN